MKLLTKISLVLMGIVLLVCGVTLKQWPDGKAHIVFCDVGQGDGILIWQGFRQLVVDSGKDDQILKCLGKYLPWWDRHLEVVVATHADADHIGGFDEVLAEYSVSQILITDQAKSSEDFNLFAEIVKTKVQKGTKVIVAEIGQQLVLGDLVVGQVIWPLRSPDKSLGVNFELTETQLLDIFDQKDPEKTDWNAGSIILLMQIGDLDVLLTGDAETPTESALIDQALTKDVDILKVGHHGSKNGTSEAFLESIKPEIAVFSNGKNNSYGHPSEDVVRRLVDRGITISRTDQEGDIHLISDHTHSSFKVKELSIVPIE